MVVRTNIRQDSIVVYDLNGKKLTQFSPRMPGRNTTYPAPLSLNTFRNRFLAAADTQLFALDMFGEETCVIDLTRHHVTDVTYISENDLYVISDSHEQTFSLIDPRINSVIRTFNCCKGPSFITRYTEKGIPLIVVSSEDSHTVHVYNLFGTLVHSYGEQGSGDGQLKWPGDVVVDQGAGITVCDGGNKRVVSFWRDNGDNQFQTLLSFEDRAVGCPQRVAIDVIHKLLAMSVHESEIRVYSYE